MDDEQHHERLPQDMAAWQREGPVSRGWFGIAVSMVGAIALAGESCFCARRNGMRHRHGSASAVFGGMAFAAGRAVS